MKPIIKKANKGVWKMRAAELLNHNIQMQTFMKKALLDMEEIHKLAAGQLEKLRLLIMPATQDALKKIAFLAGPYCEGAPGPDVVQAKPTEETKAKEDDNADAGNKKNG